MNKMLKAFETSATGFATNVYRGEDWSVYIDSNGNLLYHLASGESTIPFRKDKSSLEEQDNGSRRLED